jgi:excisionase family DNA binding protein
MTRRNKITDGMEDRLLTVEEVERYLRRKAVTIRRDIRLGKLFCIRMGRHVRIPLSEVQKVMRNGYAEHRRRS